MKEKIDIEYFKKAMNNGSPEEILMNILDYCGNSTELLMESASALTYGLILSEQTKLILNLLMQVKTTENADALDTLFYYVNEIIDTFEYSTKNLNLPTPAMIQASLIELQGSLEDDEDDGVLKL